MRTFEEKYTAWIDGKLSGAELASFENELPDRTASDADRESAHRLGDLLRQYGRAPALANAEFFSHQVLARIEARGERTRTAARRWQWRWTIPQLAWAGAACLLLAAVLFKALMPDPRSPEKEPQYFAKIISTDPAEPEISATTVYTPEDNVTVIWLDGLDYLPASYTLQ